MIGHWNDHEEALLQGLPVSVQLLYLRGIRRYMDKASGLVGVRRGISLGGLSETLYEEPHCGVGKRGRPSIQQVRRMVDRLIGVGLLERKTEGKRLIFFLPMAVMDQSVQSQVGSKPTVSRQVQQDIHKDFYNSDLDQQLGSKSTVSRQVQADTPQQSTVYNSVESEVCNIPRARVDRTIVGLSLIPEEFAVTHEHKQYAGLHKLPDPHECLLGFINHHQAKGTQSANWDAEFRKWLVREKGFRKKRGKQDGAHQSNHRSAANRAEQYHDTLKQLFAEADSETVCEATSEIWTQVDAQLPDSGNDQVSGGRVVGCIGPVRRHRH